MTWLIIAAAFLVLVVLNLCLAIYESNRAIKLVGSLLGDHMESVRHEVQRLELRLEEMEHKVEQEDE